MERKKARDGARNADTLTIQDTEEKMSKTKKAWKQRMNKGERSFEVKDKEKKEQKKLGEFL